MEFVSRQELEGVVEKHSELYAKLLNKELTVKNYERRLSRLYSKLDSGRIWTGSFEEYEGIVGILNDDCVTRAGSIEKYAALVEKVKGDFPKGIRKKKGLERRLKRRLSNEHTHYRKAQKWAQEKGVPGLNLEYGVVIFEVDDDIRDWYPFMECRNLASRIGHNRDLYLDFLDKVLGYKRERFDAKVYDKKRRKHRKK